eukprot:Hpha_TRINITY_DN10639_c0_g1::TRINITY_DN10639_c0_g1_i1::g.156767::m.156767
MPGTLAPADGSVSSSTSDEQSHWRGFGKMAGIEQPVSRLVFGCLFLHNTPDPFRLLDVAWESGINCFDCAAIYGGGRCEEILGEWLRMYPGREEEAVVITKGGCAGQDELWRAKLAGDEVRADLQSSLARLGIRKVSCYMLHRDDPDKPVSEVVDLMSSLVSEGLIGSWAVSNWKANRVAQAVEHARSSGGTPPNASSVQCSLAMPKRSVWPGTEYMSVHAREWYSSQGAGGVPVLAWETLAKGFLAGRWSRADAAFLEQHHATQDVSAVNDPELAPAWRERQLIGAYLTPENFDRRDRVQWKAEQLGATPVQVSLAWVLSQPYEAFVLIGTTKEKNLLEAVGAHKVQLSPQERDWLEGIPGSLQQEGNDSPSVAYCAGAGSF